MIASVALGLLLAATILGSLAVGRWLTVRQAFRGCRCFRLQFARDTDPADLTTALAGLSGIRPPWFWAWLRLPTIGFEVAATAGGIEHRLVVPRATTGIVMTQLRANLPSVRLELLHAVPQLAATVGSELRLSTPRRPLRTDRPTAAAAAILSSLLPLRPKEQLVLSWLISPAPTPRPPRLVQKSSGQRSQLAGDGYELLPHAEALRAERAKQAEPLFWAVGRCGVSGANRRRAEYLIGRVFGAHHLLTAPGVQLQRRRLLSSRLAAGRLNRRSVPVISWPASLNAAELTAALGLPVGLSQLSGLTLGGCRQLPPAAAIPSRGFVVAQSSFPGSERPLAISSDDVFLHSLCCAPTGAGKSVLMQSLCLQAIEAGRGVVVIEPAGDLVDDLLQRLPRRRLKDVVLLDPADLDRPVGFNLLSAEETPPELVAEHVVHIFHELFSAFWGPRTDDVLRSALLTLMREPGMTLAEVPLLLGNATFRRRLVAGVQDDVVGLAPFWAWYEQLSEAERGQATAPLSNKLRQTLLRQNVKYAVAQSQPALNIERVLREQKLLFVPLRKGLLGDEAAALLGALIVSRVWQSVQGRSALPPGDRPATHLFVDEVQDYLRLPTSIGDMLAQSRKFRLAVHVAFQHLGQLSPELRADLLANCRSKIVFQTTAKDARSFEQEFRPYLTADDLQGLGRFEVVAQLAAGQQVAPPATGRTLPPRPVTGQAAAARQWSREHYGRARDEIEAEIQTRHRAVPPDAPVGRKRRSPRSEP